MVLGSGAELSSAGDVAYIVGPVLGGVLLILLVSLLVLASMARKKRSMHGKYNPQKQEFNGVRNELNELKLKPPPEERLI